MKIPNADKAVVDVRKLSEYALNSEHRVGKNKAKLFAALLDIDVHDADAFAKYLIEIIVTEDAELRVLDEYGQRYQIDFLATWRGNKAMVRTAWIIRDDEDFPRLVTCYPLK